MQKSEIVMIAEVMFAIKPLLTAIVGRNVRARAVIISRNFAIIICLPLSRYGTGL